MVEISRPYASVWVKQGEHEFKVDLSDFLVELFQSDPKLMKKVVLQGLQNKRKEVLKELADNKAEYNKLKLIFRIIDKITETEEFKKELKKYSPKERREIRKYAKEAVADVNSILECLEYEFEDKATRLNKLREMIMELEQTDPDLIKLEGW